MIITLKGANFSTNNINDLLNSYSISYYGNGVSGSPSSVAKDIGGDLTCTLTIAEGYTYKSLSVSVGGVTLNSNQYEVIKSGNKVIIYNANITGNIMISVVTEGSGVVDPDEPTTATTYYFKDQAEKGYLFGGYVKESETSRTTDFIDISHKPKIGYYGRMGYVASMTYHALEFYDSNKTYISDLSIEGTGSPMVQNIDLSDSKYANAYYVRASVAMGSYSTADLETWYFIVGGNASADIPSGPSGVVTNYFPINEYIAADSHTEGDLGDFIDANGGNAYRTGYVSIAGKSTVNYTGRMGTIGCNYAFYDSDKNVIPGLELVGDGKTVTKTINLTDSKYANAAYIVASISKGSISDADWNRSYFAIS